MKSSEMTRMNHTHFPIGGVRFYLCVSIYTRRPAFSALYAFKNSVALPLPVFFDFQRNKIEFSRNHH